jgi:hypothetical protein
VLRFFYQCAVVVFIAFNFVLVLVLILLFTCNFILWIVLVLVMFFALLSLFKKNRLGQLM